jgi:formamidase
VLWHPDIPMVAKVKPGDDFIISVVDWTGGQIRTMIRRTMFRDVVDLSRCIFFLAR